MSGLLESILERRASVMTTNPQSPAYWAQKLFGGTASSTGLSVTEDSAIKYSAVYAGIKMIAEDVAGLPLPVYRRQGEAGRVKLTGHPIYRLLNKQANPEMTAYTFRELLTGHMLLRGWGLAEKQRGSTRGDVTGLWPLRPDRMVARRNGEQGLVVEGAEPGRLFYVYTLPNGQTKVFDRDNIFNLRNYGPNGIQGYDLITIAAESIALGLATEQYSGKFYGNGAVPDAVLTHPAGLSDPAYKRLQQTWKDTQQGLSNAHRMAILEEGLDIKTIGVDPEKAALIKSREFQIIDFARFLRIPPTMLGILGDATFSNVGELALGYAKFTIKGPVNRWESQIDADLLPEDDLYAEHLMDELMRANAKERGEFYQALRAAGGITSNQIADKENLERSVDPIADQLLIPVNMLPASAYDQDGMTMKDRATIAARFVSVGFDPAAALAQFGFDPMAHNGLPPATQQPVYLIDPKE